MTFAALLLTLVTLGSITVYESSASQQLLTTPESGSWRSEKSWAQYSPYSPAGKYEPLPAGCSVNQVNIIQRHGARYPTSGAGKRIIEALKKLQSVKSYNSPKLQFLKTYTYELGEADLVKYGAIQSFNAGELTFERYRHLVDDSAIPFVRASGSDRVVQSATNWTAGFATASSELYIPTLNLIIPETDGSNNTLDDGMCPNAGEPDPYTDEWFNFSFAGIRDRLNSQAPGANLDVNEVYSIMSICPFDTVAYQTRSPFCNIFSNEEFAAYEYGGDLDKYYGTGYGEELGRIQGVGYVNELLARLTSQQVSDQTQSNSTLDSSPTTFPLNRTIYTDFSHDNQMIAIYTALGLFNQPSPLNTTNPDPSRTWIASHMVSFAARMVTERVECRGTQFVRIFVNEKMQPLEFCGAGNDGLCMLDKFVESQTYARNNGQGDFAKCFV